MGLDAKSAPVSRRRRAEARSGGRHALRVNGAGDYRGHVGDGTWSFDPQDGATHFCSARGRSRAHHLCPGFTSGCEERLALLEEALPAQIHDRVVAARDFPRLLGEND